MTSPLTVNLPVYEGPLDLLLDLIRRQQLDIYDIPIARITGQYLNYIQQAAELNLEVGAEFIYMAATLIHIKSRLLLPVDPALAVAGEEEDPRQELVNRLLEHERFKNAAEMLHQKRLIEEAVWSNPRIGDFVSETEQGELAVTLFDLVKTLQIVLDRARNRPVFQVGKEDVSVPEMILYLKALLHGKPAGESLAVAALFDLQPSRRHMICLLLAILELVRMHAVLLRQREAFGEIFIRRHKRFDELVASEQILAAVRQEYS